jgi:uroporphyrin-III C-methyltransferase
MSQSKKGSFIAVGTGINAAGHITTSARSQIQNADIVFAAQACPLGMQLIYSLNDNVFNLGDLYSEGKSRVITYRQMVEHIVKAVQQGQRVCGAFYGHPGVFVYASHQAIKQLKKLGFDAHMEPGISAEDCVMADLGLNPGDNGLQALEVTQFLFYKHTINPHNLLIIWQFGLTGDIHFDTLDADKYNDGLAILRDELLAYYPPEHEVILYEASTIIIEKARIERMPLADIVNCKPTVISTLVVPSVGLPEYDHKVMAKFGITAAILEDKLDGLLDD